MADPLHGFNPFPWAALLPALLGAVFFLSSQNALRRTTAGRYFLILLIFASLWSLSYFFALRAPTPERAGFWIRVSVAYFLAFPSLCYLLNVSILGPAGPSVSTRALLMGPAALFLLLHLTTDGFVREVALHPWGYFPVYTLPFLFFLGFFLIIQILILRDVFLHYRQAPPGAIRSRDLLLLTTWAVVFTGSADFLIGYGLSLPPISGLPVSFFILMFFLLFRRYGISDFFQYLGLGSILNFSQDPIFLIRIDGTLQYINRETAGTLGYDRPQRLTGKPVNSLFSPATPLHTEERVAILRRRENIPAQTLRLNTLAGETIPVRTGMSGVFNRRGEMLGMVAIGRDIREELRNEQELLQVNRSLVEKVREVEERTRQLTEANRALEQNRTAMMNILEDMEESHGRLEDAYRRLSELDRTKDVFLSSVSHELRTPLTSIRSFSEILLNYPTEGKDVQKEFLSIIHQESERLTRLVDDLLDIAKIESGKSHWKRQRLNIREMFSTAVKTFSVLAREKGLTLHQTVENDLPELWMDRDRIYQVIYNLLTNAIKFTPSQGTIRLYAGRAPLPLPEQGRTRVPQILIQVADSGRGIPPEDLPFIFEKFHQGAGLFDDKPQGTGLGLAISKEIVQYYGGSIWVESEPGQGSRISFTLPVTENREPSGEGRPEEAA